MGWNSSCTGIAPARHEKINECAGEWGLTNYKILRAARRFFLIGFLGFEAATPIIGIALPAANSIAYNLSIVSMLFVTLYFIALRPELKALERAKIRAVEVAIVTGEGKLVLIQQGTRPRAWTLPGGIWQEAGTPEAACTRLAKEATGLDVEIIRSLPVYLDIARDPQGSVISTPFFCEIAGGTIQAGDGATAIATFRKQEVRKLHLPPGCRKVIRRCALFGGDKYWYRKVIKKYSRRRKNKL